MALETPKISVIIPAYNMEEWLTATVESVLAQDFHSFEILIIDDGSNDRTGDIADNLALRDDRVRVFHIPNGGVTNARFNGVYSSNAEWIMFHDADDKLPTNALSLLYEHTKYCNVDIIRGSVARIDRDDVIQLIEKESFYGLLDSLRYQQLIATKPRGLHGTIYRKSLFEKQIHIDRRIVNNEDYLINVILSQRARMIFGDKRVVHYYLSHEGSVSKRKYSEEYWYFFFSYCNLNLSKYEISDEIKNRFILGRIFNLTRRGIYKFVFSHPSFKELKSIRFSKKLGMPACCALFLLKYPSEILVSLLKIHPRRWLYTLIK